MQVRGPPRSWRIREKVYSRRDKSGVKRSPSTRSEITLFLRSGRFDAVFARALLAMFNPPSSGKRPGAVGFAAGHALDLALEAAKRERIDDVTADASLVVAEGRNRFDPAGERPLGPFPNQGHPILKLGQRQGDAADMALIELVEQVD